MRPFLFALVLALAAGTLGAYGFRRSRYAQPISPELARSALAREVAEARALGFEPQGEPEARSLDPSDPYQTFPVTLASFELEAGQCVAVVAAAQGWGKLSWLRLSRECPERWTYRDPNDLSLHEHVSGVVSHVQFCAWEPTHAELCVEGDRTRVGTEEQASAPPTVVFQVLRASEEAIGGVARLNRGMLTVRDPAESTESVATDEGFGEAAPARQADHSIAGTPSLK